MLIGSIELGGTKTICCCGRQYVDFIDENNLKFIPTGSDPDIVLQEIKLFFQQKELSYGESLSSLGIASFGPICLDKSSVQYGYITSTPKPGWSYTDIVGFFRKTFGEIPIAFDTDVNGAALGEQAYGAAVDLTDFVYITVGTGIGVGVVANGKLLHGDRHPEVGHIFLRRMESDSFAGACPFHGDCWEGLCSGYAILQRTGLRAEDLPIDHIAWRYEVYYMSQAICNIVYCYSPKRVICGGSICKGGKMGRTKFMHSIRQNVLLMLNCYLDSTIVSPSKFIQFIVSPGQEDKSGVVGGYVMALSAFLDEVQK